MLKPITIFFLKKKVNIITLKGHFIEAKKTLQVINSHVPGVSNCILEIT